MAETGNPSGDDALDRADDLAARIDALRLRTDALTSSANTFSSAMARAFTQATIGGKQLDDVFRSLVLQMSNLALAQAFKPISNGISSGLNSLIGNLVSGFTGISANARGAVKPFAAGGVIGTPTYFPMSDAGLGLAGEAGRRRSCRWRAGRTAGSASPRKARAVDRPSSCRSRRPMPTASAARKAM